MILTLLLILRHPQHQRSVSHRRSVVRVDPELDRVGVGSAGNGEALLNQLELARAQLQVGLSFVSGPNLIVELIDADSCEAITGSRGGGLVRVILTHSVLGGESEGLVRVAVAFFTNEDVGFG